jgi:hypothetical protein
MFEDVTISVQGNGTSKNLLQLCMKQFREVSPRIQFRFRCTEDTKQKLYSLNDDRRTIYKNVSNWNCVLISDIPLDRKISYFEVLLADRSRTGEYSGVFVGVTDDTAATADDEKPINIKHTCAVFNTERGNRISNQYDSESVRVNRSARTKTGDIMGVVVDRIQDKIIFYLNGVYLGEGIKGPSNYGTLYAYVNTYFETEVITLVEKHDFKQLDNRKII